MRPLTIEIEGFTAFRERIAIDFTDVELFVLHGPTGSGKSSILDAMTFALYGVVPRIGTQGVSALVSTGSNRALISLTFRSGDKTYRVTRKLYSTTTPATATLHELRGDNEVGLADGVRETKEKVAAMIGIDYEAFSRAVLLPQGKFAEFLHSAPKDRRNVLKELFQIGYLDKMGQLARGRAAEASRKMEDLQNRLAEDFAGVSEDALAATTTALAETNTRLEALDAERKAADAALREVEALAKLTGELAAARAALADLDARAATMDAQATRLARADAAETVLPALDEAEEQRRTVTRAREAAEAAQRAVDDAAANVQRAQTELDSAVEGRAQVDTWNKRIAELDRIAEILADVARAREALAARQQRMTAVTESTAKTAQDREAALQAAQIANDQLAAIDVELAAVPFDPAWLAALDDARDDIVALLAARNELPALQAEVTRAREALDIARRAEHEARHSAASAAADADRARAAATEAAARVDELELADRAAALRTHLHDGDSCPVCAQTVAQVPGVDPEVAARLQAARDAADAARTAADDARSAATKQEMEASRAAQAAATAQGALTERTTAVEAAIARIDTLAARLTPLTARAPVETLLDEHTAQREARKTHDALRARRQAAEADVVRHEYAAQLAAQSLAGLAEQAAAAAQDVREAEQQLAEREQRLGGDGPADPAAEIAALRRQVAEATTRHEAAQVALADARALQAAEQAALAAKMTAVTEANALLARRESALSDRLTQTGFPDADAARAAVLAAVERSRLRTELDEWSTRRRDAQQHADRLAAEAGDRVFDEAELTRCREAAEAVAAAEKQARTDLGRLQHEQARLQDALGRAARYRSDLAAARDTHRIYDDLAGSLRSDAFLEFVLEERMQSLVAGASHRLEGLSGRYQMRYRDDAFWVADLDNAGEEREARTLSGGETFLASLALALELSEQIQQTAGALHLDSLFIDEGFGTLDPETLDTVAEAIESLQKSGRLVGVITHVADLRDRLPHRIEVVKGVGGSTISAST